MMTTPQPLLPSGPRPNFKINLSKNNMFRTKMSIKIKNQNTQQIPPTLQKFMI